MLVEWRFLLFSGNGYLLPGVEQTRSEAQNQRLTDKIRSRVLGKRVTLRFCPRA
jgi:hypothetical protein